MALTQNYDALTVADICAEADVGRSAFYAHFTCKDDLLRHGFLQLEAELSVVEPDHSRTFSERFFAHALAHRPLYLAMAQSQAAAIATMSIRRILAAQIVTELGAKSPAGAPNDLRSLVLGDLLMTVMRWWLDREPVASVARVERIYRELASGILGVDA